MFRSAKFKLAALYTLGIAFIMLVFSVALYAAISASISNTTEVPESVTPAVEHSILEVQLARARLALLGVNAVGWTVAAAASYLIAGRTLSPIEAALARQRQFTAHASHELRTPLTVIKGEIGVTQARDRSPEEYRMALERIDAEVNHLDTMASDLLALARMEGGLHRADRQSRNVSEVLSEVLDTLSGPITERHMHVTIVVPAMLESTLDWNRARLLLINLIENAALYGPEGGDIRISASQAGRSLELSVFNSGTSIPQDEMPHLFVPFYRGKHVDPESGSGLGLALCEWIVRTHGGTIEARNMADGVAFIARLPQD